MTDGGLALDQGTHGWVISMGNRILFQIACPVNGPFDTGSSTRCELSGYASVLLFLDRLSQFWGVCHYCRFTWYCDSKAALSRVRRFATRSSIRGCMPPDADLLSTILRHSLAIKCRICHRWVKGHQDASALTTLSKAATLNVKADELATGYRTYGILQSSSKIEHIDEQRCSMSINGTPLTSQFDECVRYHVNGYHLQQYIQEKNGWPDGVWNDDDFQVFGSHYRRLSVRLQITRMKIVQITRMKIVHDQLPTGERRLRQAAIPDESLCICPCCRHATETAAHLFQCVHNSQRGHHMLHLKSVICTSDIHPVRYLLWAGMDHWLSHGDDALFHPPLDDFPPNFYPHLHGALEAQRAIGWGERREKSFHIAMAAYINS